MKSYMALLSGVFLLNSCSVFEEPGPPLREIWRGGYSIAGRLATSSVGAVDDEHFYAVRERIGNDRLFVAFERDTGEEAWRGTVTGPCSPPVVAASRVFCPGDKLFAFDGSTGRPLWTSPVEYALQLTQGAADNQRAYVGTSGAEEGDPGVALAFDASSGTLVWRRTFATAEWSQVWIRSLTLSPEGDLLIAFQATYVRNQIFSASVIVAVDPATGDERWRFVDGDRTTDRDIGGLTIWEDLMLYSNSTGKEAIAVNRRTRQVAWRVPLLPNSFSGVRPPLVKDGVAYFTDTQGGVFAVDARTGQQRWRTDQPYGYQSHEVCGDIVYGNDILGDVLDRATGRPLGRPLGEDDSMGQAAVADDVLYLSAESGVYAFDCTRS